MRNLYYDNFLFWGTFGEQNKKPFKIKGFMVEISGFEPLASSLRTRRSTN